MNVMSKPADTTAPPTNKELVTTASNSATNLRDAIYAMRIMVTRTWDSGCEADMARNALDWISQKMDEECDALTDALLELEHYRGLAP